MNAASQPCPPCSPDSRHSVCSPNSLHSQSEAGSFDEHFAEGQKLLKAGDKKAASLSFCRAAAADPRRWCEMAMDLSEKHPDLAITCLSEVLNLNAPPEIHAAAWHRIGRIHAAQGRQQEAMECVKKAGDAKPQTDQPTPFQLHYQAAIDLLNAGDAEKAGKKFLQAGIADPEKFCGAIIETGRLGQPLLALGCLADLLKAFTTDQLKAAVWCAIGNVYSNEGQRPEAMESFQKSWSICPHPGTAANRALLHLWNEEVDDAEHWIQRSLDMDPWLTTAQFVQSMITMVGRGKYLTGFKQYECRWRGSVTDFLKKLPSDKPEWTGPEQSEGRLLVYGEQGMGDTILALRYAKFIKKLGLKQIWVVQKPLATLAQSLGVIDEVRSPGEEFKDYDFHVPAVSLPRLFKTTIENVPNEPYICPPRYSSALAGLHVGIAWCGSGVNRNNAIRSADLHHWKPVLDLASNENVHFHSFQVGDGAMDALRYPQIKIRTDPKDWLETAERLSWMHLVITVDTALMHLAGAMGVPCWCALHCRPYFVFPLTRKDTPWYPSVRLFKQKREHEWAPVFERIADDLRKSID